MNAEDIVMVVVALAVFAGVFYVLTSARAPETTIKNVRVLGQDWNQSIQKAFSPNELVLRQELVNGSDGRNSAVAIMSAEITRAMRVLNKTVTSYGVVEGLPPINCNAQTNNCSGERIVVRVGTCNCLDTRGNAILIEGNADFLSSNAANVRDILYGVVAGGKNNG